MYTLYDNSASPFFIYCLNKVILLNHKLQHLTLHVSPPYRQPLYEAEVSEDVLVGWTVATVTATDADAPDTSNSRLHYSLAGPGADKFSIHPDTGGRDGVFF